MHVAYEVGLSVSEGAKQVFKHIEMSRKRQLYGFIPSHLDVQMSLLPGYLSTPSDPWVHPSVYSHKIKGSDAGLGAHGSPCVTAGCPWLSRISSLPGGHRHCVSPALSEWICCSQEQPAATCPSWCAATS